MSVRGFAGFPSACVTLLSGSSGRTAELSNLLFCLSRPLKGSVMLLARFSVFTAGRLWGFPDWWPEPAHKARSGAARGNSTVGRM